MGEQGNFHAPNMGETGNYKAPNIGEKCKVNAPNMGVKCTSKLWQWQLTVTNWQLTDSDNDKSNWQGFQKGIQNWLNAKIILYMLIKRIFVKLYN